MIGTSVCTPTFRYQPAEVAHTFATLAVSRPVVCSSALGRESR